MTVENREGFEAVDNAEPARCVDCGGPMYSLGTLGHMMWYRCRDCGIEEGIKVYVPMAHNNTQETR